MVARCRVRVPLRSAGCGRPGALHGSASAAVAKRAEWCPLLRAEPRLGVASSQWRHYEVKYKDGAVLLEAHLKIDEATSPDQCLRIYWYVDQDERALVIGHVGRHLPD